MGRPISWPSASISEHQQQNDDDHHDDHENHEHDDDQEETERRQQTNQSAAVESSANGPASFFSHMATFSKVYITMLPALSVAYAI